MLLPLLPLLTRALTLSRYGSAAMSTVTVSPAMAILDKLIDHVTHLPTTAPASHGSSSSSPSSSSSALSSASSYLPSHTSDIAWRPIIPVGHTRYTWVGDDDAPATTTTTTTPATTILTSSAVPQPDHIAAAAASLPVPPTAVKPVKEKKPAAVGGAASKGKKEEEKKTDQPDISRIDIRVGQIVRAWRHPEGQPQPHTDTHRTERAVVGLGKGRRGEG